MEKTTQNTRRLVEGAVMVAVATVLSLIKVFEMPMGGSITLFSMLPIALIAVKYGTGFGLATAFVYSLGQMFLGLGSIMGWGLTPAVLAGSIILDYILAFTVIGLSGLFRKHGNIGICSGVALALFLRFLCHVLSGVIFFSEWAWEGWSPLLYSVCYNGSFMLPELVLTMVGAVLLCNIPALKKLTNSK